MKRIAVIAAISGAALALASGALASGTWRTETAAVNVFKTRGVTFADGSRTRISVASCAGRGPSHGPIASPAFRSFSCTLATESGTFYDVIATARGASFAVRVIARY
jgi:hypothetical protein